MRGINKIILVGTLGADPDVKVSANGSTTAHLSVATSEEWKDSQSGQKQQKTEWHRVVIFGKLAEIAQQYLRKGSQVYLEGKLKTNKWQDKNGLEHYSTEVVISGYDGTMYMVGNRQNSNSQETNEMLKTNVQSNYRTDSATQNSREQTTTNTTRAPQPPGPPQSQYRNIPQHQSSSKLVESNKQPPNIYNKDSNFEDDIPF